MFLCAHVGVSFSCFQYHSIDLKRFQVFLSFPPQWAIPPVLPACGGGERTFPVVKLQPDRKNQGWFPVTDKTGIKRIKTSILSKIIEIFYNIS